MGRQQAVAFVEDDEGAEAAGAGQAAGVGEDFLEQDAEDEGAFVSSRWATLTMTAGVRPFLGVSHSRMSREQLWRQLAKVGEASRVLRVAARPLRP